MIQLFSERVRVHSNTRDRGRQFSWRLFVMAILSGVVFASLVSWNGLVSAQKRDHLTDDETELVRYYQELDKRIEVFIKAIDRRFAIISGTVQPVMKKPKTKRGEDPEPDWGALPKGTHTELLGDIAGILDEAITNLDDASQHDEKNPLISRSLRKLTASANGYLSQLAALSNQTKDADELAAIERAADNAKEIIGVGSKLPAPTPEPDKKKKP